jgi:hypothetical protein
MTKSRTDIYHYLDQNGIRGNFFSSYGFGFNMEAVEVETKFSTKFKLAPNPFGLQDEEFEEIIIDYIFETTNIRVETLLKINQYSSIDGLPFIIQIFRESDTLPTFTLAFSKIKGTIVLIEEYKIQTLGNIEAIEGDLKFKGSSVASLGKLKKVSGSIYIRQFDPPFTKLQSLERLEYVGGDLVLKQSPITDLGMLRYVGGNLNLRNTGVSNLGELKYVGGNLFLPRSKKDELDTSGIQVVGNVKYFAN